MLGRVIAIAIALLLALVGPGAAEDCVPTTSQPEVDTDPLGLGEPLFRAYVDADPCAFERCSTVVLWIYFEDNGIPGLQRWDPLKDDTCGGAIPSDLNTSPS